MILFPSLVTVKLVQVTTLIHGPDLLTPSLERADVALRLLACAATGRSLVGSLAGATVSGGRGNQLTGLEADPVVERFGELEEGGETALDMTQDVGSRSELLACKEAAFSNIEESNSRYSQRAFFKRMSCFLHLDALPRRTIVLSVVIYL